MGYWFNSQLENKFIGCSEVFFLGLSGVSLENGRVLRKPVLEVIELSVAVVVDSILVVLRVEDQGWVSLDLHSIGLVDGGIELGDHEVFLVLVELTELVPDGSKLLAVSAPWGVEFYNDKNNTVKSYTSDVCAKSQDSSWEPYDFGDDYYETYNNIPIVYEKIPLDTTIKVVDDNSISSFIKPTDKPSSEKSFEKVITVLFN